MADVAAQRRDPAVDGAAPVGVLGEDDARLADPPGRGGEGSALGIAEDRDGLARHRRDRLERRRSETSDAEHRDVVADVEGDDDGVAVVAVAAVDARILHPGDDVRVRDDEVRRRRPARAGDAETAGAAGDAEDAVAGGADARACQQRRIGWRNVRLRPADREERVDARDRVEQARRRHTLVDLAEDPRALHLLSQLPLAGQVERDRAQDPDDRGAGGGAEHEPAEGVEPPQRRQREEARPDRAAGHRRDALEEDHEHGRPAERDERRVRRLAAGEELRRELGAEVRADGDPGQSEQPADEPAPEADQSGERDHADRDPVDGRHSRFS